MKLSVLVVLYNQELCSIGCLSAALASEKVDEIIVCDNSAQINDNARQADDIGVTYIAMGGNKGLPAAYNIGVQEATGDVVCFFDDDTIAGSDYFEAVFELCESSSRWDIALPLVMAGGVLLSPCRFRGCRVALFSDVSLVEESSNMSGINSGMAIKRSALAKVSYDDRLFLDLVDHKLILDARRMGLRVVYLKGPVLEQDFSLETDAIDAAARRLSIFAHDARIFYSVTLSARIYCELMLLYRRMRLCCRYRTLRFLCVPKFEKGAC